MDFTTGWPSAEDAHFFFFLLFRILATIDARAPLLFLRFLNLGA